MTTQTGNKTVLVAVPAANDREKKEFKVELQPGTRAFDVLTKLALKGFVLKKPDGSNFAPMEVVYDKVSDGQKLYAEPSNVDAG